MDPIFEEMARAREVQPRALRRWVEHLVTVIQPQLDELAALKAAAQQAADEPAPRKGAVR